MTASLTRGQKKLSDQKNRQNIAVSSAAAYFLSTFAEKMNFVDDSHPKSLICWSAGLPSIFLCS